MKKLPMILLLFAPYVILFVCSVTYVDFSIGLYIYGSLLIFNMIYAFLLPRIGFNGKRILLWNLVLKLCHIPLIVLILLVVLMTSMIGGEGIRDEVFSIAMIALLACYILQLSSAVFGFSGLLRCHKQGTLSKLTVAAGMLAQLIPCVDVIGSIICYLMVRNKGEPFDDASLQLGKL